MEKDFIVTDEVIHLLYPLPEATKPSIHTVFLLFCNRSHNHQLCLLVPSVNLVFINVHLVIHVYGRWI